MKRVLLLLPLLVGACARPTPEATLRRYLEHVIAGRYRPAYRLTSPAYQARCDLLCFRRTVERSRPELAQALAQLQAGDGARVEITTEITSPSLGGPLKLVRSAPGTWRIAGDPLDFYPQDTPQQALRSFVRAAEARRYDVLLRFVPQKLSQQATPKAIIEGLRQRLEGSLRQQIEEVKRHLSEPLIVDGAEARLPLSPQRGEVRLLLEEGRWRVLQLQ